MLSTEIKQTIERRCTTFATAINSNMQMQLQPAPAAERTDRLAASQLYSAEELSLVPLRARLLFQGCGNPVSAASLLPGESVVDLGCGAGFDLILAARRIGAQGRVFGVDLSGSMVEQARLAVAEGNLASANIILRENDIEGPRLPKCFADVLLANNVIHLCPDKTAVFRNIFRALMPGARLVIADIIAADKLDGGSLSLLQAAWTDGAALVLMNQHEYLRMLVGLGFIDIWLLSRQVLGTSELEALAFDPASQTQSPLEREKLAQLDGKLAAVTWSAVRPPLNC